MVRSVRWYVFGFVGLVALAGCGRGLMQYVQREPWREQAEVACLKSGTVRENPAMVRIAPIEGPGICGATHPLKVAAFGVGNAYGYSDEKPRPPGSVGSRQQPRWPVTNQQLDPATTQSTAQPRYVPSAEPRMLGLPSGDGRYAAQTPPPPSRPVGNPMSISPPGIDPYAGAAYPQRGTPSRAPNEPDDNEDDDRGVQSRPAAPPPVSRPLPALGPQRAPNTLATPIEVKPAATLACPIVSALEQWVINAVQPAAHKWFGQPVVEIRQISAYSCRGMNGQVGARISEHAFGNALDIAAFVLADGKRITVKNGWQGSAEEQGFLRDVQGAACDQFTTVLAPGSNRFHYDHIHVDLMRRGSGRRICQPGAVDGEVVAARVRRNGSAVASRSFNPPQTRRYDPPPDARNDPYAWRGDSVRRGAPGTTGSIAGKRAPSQEANSEDLDWVEDPSPRPAIDWSADRHKVY